MYMESSKSVGHNASYSFMQAIKHEGILLSAEFRSKTTFVDPCS
jgi:hypothetical protein